ncbi:E2AK4 kinase, partial [Polypterus senegalus]
MSSGRSDADPLDDYRDRQENEVEALASIYGDDFTDLRQNHPWKVKRPPEFVLTLRPQGLTSQQEIYVLVDLGVRCPPTYPDVPAELQLKNAKGLSNDSLRQLQSDLERFAAELCGEVMIFQLAEHVQSFLSERNIPPPKSFHEEMLKNQRRQQERIAQEEQQRIDQQKKHEAQMEKEILAAIQKREEEKREEKKRKEIAKQERLDNVISTSPDNTVLGKHLFFKGNVSDQEEPKKGGTSRRRTQSNGRTRRDRQYSLSSNDESFKPLEVLRFSAGCQGDIVVHRGKCIGESERLGRSVYNALDASSGDFMIVYQWILHWNKKIGKFFTSQEKEKIEKCKKQIQGAESEVNSLLKLEHPNLVHYAGASNREQEDSLIVDLLAEHINGSSLSSGLGKGATLPLERIRHYALQLLSALDYLHNNSVVHKMLSASSVLVDSEGTIKLTDYSISKRLADICKEDVFEQTRVRFCEDSLPNKTGKKGDVWNLGLLLLALSQGREVKEYPVVIPTGLPSEFQDFLNRCVCLGDLERWTTQQLLGHSFINPPVLKSPLQGNEDSPEGNDIHGKYFIVPKDTGVDFVTTVIPHGHMMNASFSTVIPKQFSRYYNEFEELQLLGKGAFGAVIKVQNKLDGCCYAVKRIQVNPTSKQFRRIKGEVTLLSRLNHENIVRYYNAWIERHEIPSTGVLSSESSEQSNLPAKTLEDKVNELGLVDDVEDNAPPPALASSVEWSTSIEKSSSAKCNAGDQESSDEDDDEDVFCLSFIAPKSDSESDIIFENGEGSEDSLSQEEARKINVPELPESREEERTDMLIAHYLYIQMEYCEKSTLRDTIDQGLYKDVNRLWRFFREILDGLAYIHEKGMIHRDLKPVNIFLDSKDHMKIGDFGLATDHPVTDKLEVEDGVSAPTNKQDPTDNMTGMVGTALYVSPEVQRNTKATYNQKVDLYSLGIIFFEMCYRPMDTASERISVLMKLRQLSIVFPEDFEDINHGSQRLVISWLLNHDPALRPTALEVLKSEHLPPSQMEESELHGVLHHTLANIDGKAYRTMVNQLHSQSISPVMDFTYDIDLYKGNFSASSARLHQHVYEVVRWVFKKHGAMRLQTPLLMPKNKKLYEGSDIACFMDHSGMLVNLPYDLRERNYSIYLNHTSLLKAIMLHSGIPEDKLGQSSTILCDAMLQTLYKYIEQKGDLQELSPLINTLTKQKTAVSQLAKQGLKDLEELTGLLKKLGIKQQLLQFRGPEAPGPIPSAVGASLALDKICAAVASMEDPPSGNCCDILVVAVGYSSMGRAISIIQKLWTIGVSAEIMYDASQSQEALQEHCKQAGITFLALVSDKEGNYIKVKCFEKDRQSEKRILESDLVDHLFQRSRARVHEDRNVRQVKVYLGACLAFSILVWNI